MLILIFMVGYLVHGILGIAFQPTHLDFRLTDVGIGVPNRPNAAQ